MPLMATIRHHVRINASPDDVWAVVSDAGGIADWAPGIEPGSVEWDEATSTRTIDMGGLKIVEQVVTSDDELRRLQYKITEAPMPVEFHLATVDVFADGEGTGTFLVYSCEVAPDEGKALFDPIAAGLVDALKAHAER
jgi:carbon monoxide dehydrogenase subunit G